MATKKIRPVLVLATVGILAGWGQAQVLFNTQEDFAGWQDNNSGVDFVGAPVATPDSEGSAVNGLGNTTNAGGAGTAGSEQITWQPAAGTYGFFYSPGEQTNAGFLSAIDPGSSTGNLVSYSGTIEIDTILPPPGTGNYFSIGLVLNYNGNFSQFFGGAPSSPNANGFVTTAIPYTINATSLTYFQLGIIYNSNYTGTPFYVDNIRLAPAPVTFSDVDGNWVKNGSGNWEAGTNWSSNPQIPGGSPDTYGSQVTFDNNGGAITTNPTVTLSQSATMGYLVFGSTGGGTPVNYTINAGDPAAAINVTYEIDAYSGTHVVNVPVNTGGNFYFEVDSGASLSIPRYSIGGYGSITKLGTGALTLGGASNVNLYVDGTFTEKDNTVSTGWFYGINVNGDGVVNLGVNTFNTNGFYDHDGSGNGVINIPTGGVVYDALFGDNSYSAKLTGGGSIVIGGNVAVAGSDTVAHTASFYGNDSGFSGTMTVSTNTAGAFTLQVVADSALGDGSSTNKLILDGGIFQALGSLTGTQGVQVTAHGGTIDTNSFAVNLGAVSSTAGGTLTKISAGTFTVKKMTGIALNVSGGRVEVAPDGTSAGASTLTALTIAADASFDITNNSVSIAKTGTSLATVLTYLHAGFDGGKWDTTGIISTSVASQLGTSVGYADGDVDSGTAAAPGTVLVMDTWLGDLNLDGGVTSADVNKLLADMGMTGADWAQGDLNYDNKVNGDDLSLMLLGMAEYKAGGSVPVPEPASFGLVAAAGVGLLRRRRR